MSANQLEIIINQVRLLPPDDLVELIRQTTEILEQKRNAVEKPATNYAAFIGAGKGLFATPEEADRFIREERDAWEE